MAGTADIGLIGLAVMGENLVLNIESRGYTVAVFNRTVSKVDDFMKARGKGKKFVGCHSIEEFMGALKTPRKVMLMVKAGTAVDDFIDMVIPHLSKGDIVIDGGNSFFKDTIRRTKMLEEKGLCYIGTGVSGGEEGALKGPSVMPGGTESAWPEVKPILQAICAKVNGEPCCQYLGPNGAGHYIKMIHNGIEYGDMQMIAEAYFLMKHLLGLEANDMHKVFSEWNKGDLDSYLIEITQNIFKIEDKETKQPLVELILDTAEQKGTGKWTSQDALDIGIPAPTIAEAVFARCISGQKDERVNASKILSGPVVKKQRGREKLVEDIRRALYASKICSYAQGLALIRGAQAVYGWKFNFGDIALMWRGGCIIRARFLGKIKEAYTAQPDLANLLLAPYFKKTIDECQESWRKVVALAAENGIPCPAFMSSLAYYDSYRNPRLPANLLQAQRDYFGAHTFERIDKPRGQYFHQEWPEVVKD
ncbi:MAG: decarboxylating NADP(+)-dependent phosphogluconate dehydrogenase [Planctomycetota bacterium]